VHPSWWHTPLQEKFANEKLKKTWFASYVTPHKVDTSEAVPCRFAT
jgi:hypothetical protein